ncbi:MAG: biotin/lipoyl-binding protein, partial [Chlorobiota bacterium]
MSRFRVSAVLAASLLAAPSPAPAREKGALTATVEKKDLPIEIDLAGTFKAQDKTEISVEPDEYSGNLILLKLAPEGSTVKEGDILMKFDKRDLQKAVSSAQNAIDEAQLKLDKARADLATLQVEQESSLGKLKKELAQARLRKEGSVQDLAMKHEEKKKAIRKGEEGLVDARVNLEQLQGMYKRRELHTETENILLERENRQIKDQERDLEETRKKLAYFETYEMPLEKGKVELE